MIHFSLKQRLHNTRQSSSLLSLFDVHLPAAGKAKQSRKKGTSGQKGRIFSQDVKKKLLMQFFVKQHFLIQVFT